jgi:hypothetical protein
VSEKIEKMSPRDRRITRHINAIAEAGTDIEQFAAALREVRDDPQLTSAHRDAIWKTLAQEAAQAYFVFTTGKTIDIEKLIGEIPAKPG